MKAKFIIPAAAAGAVALSLCVFAMGASDGSVGAGDGNGHGNYDENSFYLLNSNAPAYKTLETFDGDSISLAYLGTHDDPIEGSFMYDVYVDAEENQYFYDTDGRLRSFISDRCIDPDEERSRVSEAYAKRVAYDGLKKFFGDRVDDFEFEYSRLRSSMCMYEVNYEITLGERGFVTGAECSVEVGDEGTLLFATMRNYDLLREFDESLLDGITKKDVAEYARQQAAEEYGECFAKLHMESAVLSRDGNGWYLRVGVSVERYTDRGDTYSIGDSYKFYL